MAGGRGKRLLPLTKKIPKAMVKVFGKPMLEHVFERAKIYRKWDKLVIATCDKEIKQFSTCREYLNDGVVYDEIYYTRGKYHAIIF